MNKERNKMKTWSISSTKNEILYSKFDGVDNELDCRPFGWVRGQEYPGIMVARIWDGHNGKTLYNLLKGTGYGVVERNPYSPEKRYNVTIEEARHFYDVSDCKYYDRP